MTATHKTFSGMMRAVDRTIAELGTKTCDTFHPDPFDRMMDSDYKRLDAKVSGLFQELNALWTNPADVTEAAKAKNRLNEAWYRATN
jgi:hypothetical protein